MLRVPLTLPAIWGANETLSPALCRGPTVMGRRGPAKLNPVPETAVAEMVTVCLPVLVTLRGMTRLFPTCTLPKLIAVVETASDICAVAERETNKAEQRTRIHDAALRGEPRQLILVARFFARAR